MVSSLAVGCILETAFIDQYVKAIIPEGRKVIPQRAKSVDIIGVRPVSEGNKSHVAQLPKECASNKIRVAKSVMIELMSKTKVLVKSEN